jgi:hypothetical protein
VSAEKSRRGGRRVGAGRKPTLRPLKTVRLHDPKIREALSALTAHEREVLDDQRWSQEQMLADLIRREHHRVFSAQIENPDNQVQLSDPPVEYRDNQTRVPPPLVENPDNQKPAAVRVAPLVIYQLRIALVDIQPEIWRRVLVRSDATLADLHDIIQICFDWEDYHLHEFGIGHGEYDADDGPLRLSRFGLRAGSSFGYVYDFGDQWVHEVEVEAVLSLSARKRYPQCIGGAQPAPEEDSGGSWEYMKKQQRSERAKAAARKRQKNRGTQVTTKKRKPTGPVYDRAQINRRLAAWAAGDDFYMSA